MLKKLARIFNTAQPASSSLDAHQPQQKANDLAIGPRNKDGSNKHTNT